MVADYIMTNSEQQVRVTNRSGKMIGNRVYERVFVVLAVFVLALAGCGKNSSGDAAQLPQSQNEAGNTGNANNDRIALDRHFKIQKVEPDFIIGNGTGKTISGIEIVPSKKRYPKDKNVYAMQDLTWNDQQSLPVFLPEHMKGMESFDILIQYGRKNAKTKKSVTVGKTNKVPVMVMSIKGKDPTIPLISGAVGGTAVAAGILGGLGSAVATTGAAGFTGLLGSIGGILGGTLIGGTAVVAAVPLAVGGGATALVFFLRPDTLIFTDIEYMLPQ